MRGHMLCSSHYLRAQHACKSGQISNTSLPTSLYFLKLNTDVKMNGMRLLSRAWHSLGSIPRECKWQVSADWSWEKPRWSTAAISGTVWSWLPFPWRWPPPGFWCHFKLVGNCVWEYQQQIPEDLIAVCQFLGDSQVVIQEWQGLPRSFCCFLSIASASSTVRWSYKGTTGRFKKWITSLASKICSYFHCPGQENLCVVLTSAITTNPQRTSFPLNTMVCLGCWKKNKGGLKIWGNAWKGRLGGKKGREESLTIGEPFISLQ